MVRAVDERDVDGRRGARPRAAASPPNPPPTITTRGRPSMPPIVGTVLSSRATSLCAVGHAPPGARRPAAAASQPACTAGAWPRTTSRRSRAPARLPFALSERYHSASARATNAFGVPDAIPSGHGGGGEEQDADRGGEAGRAARRPRHAQRGDAREHQRDAERRPELPGGEAVAPARRGEDEPASPAARSRVATSASATESERERHRQDALAHRHGRQGRAEDGSERTEQRRGAAARGT